MISQLSMANINLRNSIKCSRNPVMIESLRLKNFKGYKDSGVVPFAPLTVIIGCNNSGKSSLLQSLLALRETVLDRDGKRLVTSSAGFNIGSFHEILNKDASSEKISIEVFAKDSKNEIEGHSNKIPSKKLSLDFVFDQELNRIRISKSEIRNDKNKVLFRGSEKSWKADFASNKKVKSYTCFHWRNFLPTAHPKTNTPDSLDEKVNRVCYTMHRLTEFWDSFFRGIDNLAAIRQKIPFYQNSSEEVSSSSGHGGPSLIYDLSESEQLLEAAGYWMEKFGVIKNLRLSRFGQDGSFRSLIADDPDGSTGINVASMGEGVSQLLPIVTEVLVSESCLLIEQPEIHLNPNLQTRLADLFASSVKARNGQIVVETHSEHFVLRLKTLLASGELSPSHISLLFVGKQDGESIVEKLDIDDLGNFADWPEGFFDESYQESKNHAKKVIEEREARRQRK